MGARTSICYGCEYSTLLNRETSVSRFDIPYASNLLTEVLPSTDRAFDNGTARGRSRQCLNASLCRKLRPTNSSALRFEGISPVTKKSGSGFFSVAFLVALLWWSRRSFTMAVQERGHRFSLISL